MASELSKQLHYLKSVFPDTAAPKLPVSVAESFLFDGKRAKQLTTEQIFAIAVSGMNELCALDTRFRPFVDSLFSTQALKTNRELMQNEVNQELDQTLDRFLCLLSPYFLLRSAHKVIEFLIRKYRVHLYNVESIFKCIIPYHETLLFARWVQILSIETTKWHFLQPMQKSGAVLPRDILVQRCITDTSVLEFICDTQKHFVKLGIEHKTMTSFFAALLVEYVDQVKLKDTLLKRVLSYVFDGIKSSDKDFRVACFMVLTQIASRVTLTDTVLETTVHLIVKTMDDFSSEALMCLVFLFQSQPLKKMRADTFKLLVAIQTLESQLMHITTSYNIGNFLRALLLTLVDYTFVTKDPELLYRYMNNFALAKHIPTVVAQMFEYYVTDMDKKDICKQVLTTIERKYPTDMDKGLYLALEHVKEDDKRTAMLEFVQLSFSKHEFLSQTNSSLFLSLEHPVEAVRELAVERLKEMIHSYGDKPMPLDVKSFITDSLTQRLNDDSVKVIQKVLSIPRLYDLVNRDILVEKLSLAAKSANEKEVQGLLVDIVGVVTAPALLKHTAHLKNKIVPFLSQFVLFTNENKKTCEAVHKSLEALNHPLLQNITGTDNKKIVAQIGKNAVNQLNLLSELNNPRLQLLVLAEAIALTGSLDAAKKITELAFPILKNVKATAAVTSLSGDQYGTASLESVAIYALFVLISKLSPSGSQDQDELLHEIFAIMAEQANFSSLYLPHVKQLLTIHWKQNAIANLCSYCVEEATSPLVLEKSLLMMQTLLSASQIKPEILALAFSAVLISLAHNTYAVRYAATLCFDSLVSGKKAKGTYVDAAIKVLKESVDQLLEDPTIVFTIVAAPLAPLVEKYLDSVATCKTKYGQYVLFKCIEGTPSLAKFNKLKEALENVLSVATNSSVSQPIFIDDARLLIVLLQSVFNLKPQEIDSANVMPLFVKCLSLAQKVYYTLDKQTASSMDADDDANPNPSAEKEHKYVIPCLHVVPFVNNNLFAGLSKDNKQLLFTTLSNVLGGGSDHRVTAQYQQICKSLTVHASVITAALPALLKDSDLTKQKLEQLVLLLEMLTVMENITERAAIVPSLLKTLQHLLDHTVMGTDSIVEYATVMILSVLSIIVQGDKQAIDIAIILRCLKGTTAQVRNHAISLFGHLASVIPDVVLANLVTLLSVIETSLKHQEGVTFDVAEKALLQILPKVVEHQASDITKVFDVLVNTYSFVPAERRLNFYSTVVKKISRSKLHILISILLKNVKDASVAQFCTDLLLFFKVPKQLRCMLMFIHVMYQMLIDGSIEGDEAVIVTKKDTTESKVAFAQSLFTFMLSHIVNLDFLKQVTSFEQLNTVKAQERLVSLTENLVILQSNLATRREEDGIEAVYDLVQQIASKTVQLVSVDNFVNLVKALLKSENDRIRLHALEVYNFKLADVTPENNYALEQSKETLGTMFVVFKSLLKKQDNGEFIQTALIAAEQTVRRLGAELAIPLIPLLLPLLQHAELALVASCAITLSSILSGMQTKALEHLPLVVPRLVSLLLSNAAEGKNDNLSLLLRQALLSALDMTLRAHAKFITPYISDLISICVHPTLLKSTNLKINAKIDAIVAYISDDMQPRLMMVPMLSAYTHALQYGEQSLLKLFDIVKNVISKSKMDTLEPYHKQLIQFFLNCMDIRRVHLDKIASIDSFESKLLQVFNTFTLKLNETMFKPVLTALVDWSRAKRSALTDSLNEEDEDVDMSLPHTDRLLLFYKTLDSVMATLKTIFVPIMTPLLEHFTTDLTNYIASKQQQADLFQSPTVNKKRKRSDAPTSASVTDTILKQHETIMIMYSCLQNCFANVDDTTFQTKAKYDLLAQPLVQQLSNVNLGSVELFVERSTIICATIGQFAATTTHTFWKPLVQVITQQIQDASNGAVKVACLHALEQCFVKVGQEFIVTLPDMIPIVSELMEDDSENVTEAVKQLIQSAERITGESIREHIK